MPAAYAPWSPLPQTPAMEEKRTKASSSRSRSASRWAAPAALAATIRSKADSGVDASGASAMKAAACTTAVTGSPCASSAFSISSTAPRSVRSQPGKETRVPNSTSFAASSDAPGAFGPRRPGRTTCSAPPRASQRARCGPTAPVPPVSRTVPRGCQGRPPPAVLGARVRRRARRPVARSAIWSSPSPAAPASAAPSRARPRSSRRGGRSMSPPQRAGASRAATRPVPQTSAWPGSVTGSCGPVDTAPWVAHHRGAVTWRSPRACTSATVRAAPPGRAGCSGCGRPSAASRDSTPAGARPARAVVSLAASASRRTSSAVSSTLSTSTPSPARAWRGPWTRSSSSWSVGITTSQLPSGVRSGGSGRGCHKVR